MINLWPLKMAWRDGRADRQKLLVYTLAISVGVAALVSTSSLRHLSEKSVQLQTKVLLGADLVVSGRRVLGNKLIPILDSLPSKNSSEVRFASMIQFLKTQEKDWPVPDARCTDRDFLKIFSIFVEHSKPPSSKPQRQLPNQPQRPLLFSIPLWKLFHTQ